MTLASQISDDVADVFLNTDDFAETVSRYPLGVAASAESVTAVFAERDPSQDTTRGDDNMRTGALHVADSVDADPRDSWLIQSEVWETTSVSGSSGGMKVVEVKRRERMRTKPVGVR